MAPIKFEENIREKLEQRSLQPSANAWENLEHKLQQEDKKRSTSPFWWLGIAAGIIGILFIVQQATKPEDSNAVITPTLVDTENVEDTRLEQTLEIINKEDIIKNKPSIDVDQTQITVNELVKQKPVFKTAKQKPLVNTIDKSLAVLKNEPVKVEETPQVNTTLPEVNDETSIAEVEHKQEPTTSTDSEIDALLNAAKKEITSESTVIVTPESVDPNALLNAVETELPPSLRRQLFQTIEKNFGTVKKAVVTRNK